MAMSYVTIDGVAWPEMRLFDKYDRGLKLRDLRFLFLVSELATTDAVSTVQDFCG